MLAPSNQAWHASRTANTAWQRLRRGGTRAVTGAWLTHPLPAIPAVVVTDPFPFAATAAPEGCRRPRPCRHAPSATDPRPRLTAPDRTAAPRGRAAPRAHRGSNSDATGERSPKVLGRAPCPIWRGLTRSAGCFSRPGRRGLTLLCVGMPASAPRVGRRRGSWRCAGWPGRLRAHRMGADGWPPAPTPWGRWARGSPW
jgi:hypothetical protein